MRFLPVSILSQLCPHLLPRIKTTLTTPPKIDKCRVLHTRVPALCEGRVSTPSLDHFANFSSQNAHVAFGSSCSCDVGDWGTALKKGLEMPWLKAWKPRLHFENKLYGLLQVCDIDLATSGKRKSDKSPKPPSVSKLGKRSLLGCIWLSCCHSLFYGHLSRKSWHWSKQRLLWNMSWSETSEAASFGISSNHSPLSPLSLLQGGCGRVTWA